MGRVIYAFLVLAGVILFVVFFFQNYQTLTTPLSLTLDFGRFLPIHWGPTPIPAWVFAILLFLAGFAFAALMEVTEWVKYRTLVRSQRKRIRRLERELAKYSPVKSEAEGDDDDDDSAADA